MNRLRALALLPPALGLLYLETHHPSCGFDSWAGVDAGSYGRWRDVAVLAAAVLGPVAAAALLVPRPLRGRTGVVLLAAALALAGLALVLWERRTIEACNL
jgi:hypothetical protein